MKTLDEYTIYCTDTQIRKALKLGAEIKLIKVYEGRPEQGYNVIVTAEQIIEWLAEQGITFEILMISKKIVYFSLWRIDDKSTHPIVGYSDDGYSTRKEATLAGIDAALDYLIKINKK